MSFASGCIYRVGSRPAWNTWYTPLQFGFTAAVLGPLFAGAIGVGDAWWLGAIAAALGVAQLVLVAIRFLRLIAADSLELRGTARLLSTVLRRAVRRPRRRCSSPAPSCCRSWPVRPASRTGCSAAARRLRRGCW